MKTASENDIRMRAATVARDLGLRTESFDAVTTVCLRVVSSRRKVESVADRLSAVIEEIRSDDDLASFHARYDHRTLIPTAAAERQLAREGVFGMIVRTRKELPGEYEYLALVDSRGPKKRMAHLTRWHELVHVMMLPPAEAKSRRRLCRHERVADEHMVDAIAAHFILERPIDRAPFLPRTLRDIVSMRESLCPDVPLDMLLIAVARRLPDALLFRTTVPRRTDALEAPQLAFWPSARSRLRIALWSGNGRRFDSPHVPQSSVIARVAQSVGTSDEAIEDVRWTRARGWRARSLARVIAINNGDSVVGAILPLA